MSYFPDPRWPRQFDDNPGRHPENSSSGALMWRPPVDQSSTWEMGPLGMLDSSQ